MLRYALRRAVWLVPTLLIVTFLVYVAIRLGTDPVASYRRTNIRVSKKKLDQYIAANGLYSGAFGYVRGYFAWLWGFVTLDWPRSIKGSRDVWPHLKDALANSLRLGIVATVVGIAFSTVRTKALAALVVVASLAFPAVQTARAVRMSDMQVAWSIDDDSRIVFNEHVASWFRDNDPHHGTVWAMCASSALYALIHQAPPFRYSWFAYFAATPEALPMLYDWLDSPSRPEYVVQVQSAQRCDPSGRLGALVESRYVAVGEVMGRPVLRLRGA